MSTTWTIYRQTRPRNEEGECESAYEFSADDFDGAWQHAMEYMRQLYDEVWDDDSKWQISHGEILPYVVPPGGMIKFEKITESPPPRSGVLIAIDGNENVYYLSEGDMCQSDD